MISRRELPHFIILLQKLQHSMGKNSFFQFKQFRINQDQCAMKVCTDSCVLGAYTAISTATRILDIGTGTGLLALMLAQRTDSPIDAVEIDEAATQQARENVKNSPWSHQIKVIQQDILQFSQTTLLPYDLIVCNPPFFSNHLKRKHSTQNVAMHGEALQLPELAQVVSTLLASTGRFITLLPPYESSQLEKNCFDYGLYKYEELQLFDYIEGKQIRTINSFSFTKESTPQTKTLYIKTSVDGTYTDDFIQLLKPYYLNL
ncbi:methyltransferase [Cytophagaceae bacterium DM2B3-1]|uniref:tRNA1(Val) (adenine(37)-N6)-methyltransferase n=2 Tax=Xanthocytophaga flava TaxID=3048013 RepID=A0ABT7CN45_9BACT|nr:methyltransferase [Xanthocytophaga flavus]